MKTQTLKEERKARILAMWKSGWAQETHLLWLRIQLNFLRSDIGDSMVYYKLHTALFKAIPPYKLYLLEDKS